MVATQTIWPAENRRAALPGAALVSAAAPRLSASRRLTQQRQAEPSQEERTPPSSGFTNAPVRLLKNIPLHLTNALHSGLQRVLLPGNTRNARRACGNVGVVRPSSFFW